MNFKVLSTALILFLVALSAPAHADPITGLIVAVSKAVSAFAASSWIGSVVVGIGKSLVVGLLNMAIAKLTEKKQEAVGVVLKTEMGDDLPLSAIVGYRATAGKRKYWGTWGSVGSTPNAFFVDVIEISALPSYAGPQGLTEIWFGETKGTIKWDSPAADGRGYPIEEFRKNGVDYAWVKYLDGSQTVADPYLRAKFGNHADRPWKETMIGRGKQLLIVTCRFHTNVWSGNPEILAVPAPLRCYDLRKDSTAGGSGSHRWSDPSTWEPTFNNAVIIYNLVRGLRDQNGVWVYGGQNVAAYRLPASSWMAAANECDRVINGKPQFRCGAEISFADEPLDVIEQLRLGCNGRFILSGGTVELLVGAPAAPVYYFTDADVIITEDKELDPWPSLSDTHNTITASYPNPEDRWASKDAPEYSVEAYVAEDKRWLTHSVSFRATPYAEVVQALQKTIIEDGRRFRVHDLTLPPSARLLKPGNVLSWSSARNGYSDKQFIVERIIRKKGSLQRVTMKELEPSDYDPPAFYIPTPGGWVGKIEVPAQTMEGWSAGPATVPDANGLDRRPAIKVQCASDLDDVARVHVRVRVKATGAVVFDSDQTPYPEPHTNGDYEWVLSGAWVLPSTEYEVAGRYVPFSTRPVNWSDWITVLTPNILIATMDILAEAITAEKIANAAVSADKLMNEAVTAIKLADQAVSTAKLQVAAVTEEILANGAVIAVKLADGAIEARALKAGIIDATKFAASIEPVTIVPNASPLPVARITASIYWQSALYTWNGTAYVLPEAEVAPGSITVTEIADGAISTPKLAANAVSADKLAANSVTAGKIAAGAVSTDQLAANAVIAAKIAAAAITTDKLAVGSGKNLLQNASFTMGLDCWVGGSNGSIPGLQVAIRTPSETYAGPGSPTYMVHYPSTGPTGFYFDLRQARPDTGTLATTAAGYGYPCQPGEWFEATVYASAHRCDVELRIEWRDNLGAVLGYTAASINNAQSHSSTNPDLWPRLRTTGAAPAGAATACIHIRKRDTAAGQTDSYMFVHKPMLCRIPSNATEPTPWSDGGIVLITSGGIVAAAVTAEKIAANAVTAGKIDAGAVTATTIAAGAVTTDKLAASSVTAAKVAADAIGANHIAANSITAKQLVLADFSNMVNLGFDGGIMDAWTLSGSVKGYYSESLTTSPVYGSYIAYSNDRDMLISKLLIPVSEGESYYLSAWVCNTDQGGAAASNVKLMFFARNGAEAIVAYPAVATSYAVNAWTFIQGRYTVPAGVKFLQAFCQAEKTGNTGGRVYWGRMTVRRAMNAEMIVDGSVIANKLAANSITADKLSVTSLEAISANLGNVNISNAIIGTLQVGKDNISGGIFRSYWAGGVGGGSISFGTNVTVSTIVIDHGNDGPTLDITWVLVRGSGSETDVIQLSLYDATAGAQITPTFYLGLATTTIMASLTVPAGRTQTTLRLRSTKTTTGSVGLNTNWARYFEIKNPN